MFAVRHFLQHTKHNMLNDELPKVGSQITMERFYDPWNNITFKPFLLLNVLDIFLLSQVFQQKK